ncbi:MAG: cation transporter [Planctomycetes bacterium]|nr:cation transporter [Planctomycetota bacterium]
MAAGSKKIIYAALAGNALISITKFIASAITGSSAMMSEGIHSLVDTGNQVLLLYGLKRAKRPADKNFPFGHGKEIYFWSFVVAILIFAVGSGISIYEGILHVVYPVPVERPIINYIVLGLAMIFEGWAWWMALKEFRRLKGNTGYFKAVKEGKDPTVFVVLFEDSAALLGLAVAALGLALGQITGLAVFDGIASILIGCILGGTAVWLAYETKGLLIGEAASPEVVDAIGEMAGRLVTVETVNEVLTLHMGPDYVLVNVSLDFVDEASAADIEHAVECLDRGIRSRFPLVRRIFIEAESPEHAGEAPPIES